MAWTNLFKIGNTDLTGWEDTSKHSVNRVDEVEEWQDGNWSLHRIIRKRITGSVTLTFPRATDYAAFMTLLSTAQNPGGSYPVTVWCSNTNSTETLNAFLEYPAETVFDVTAPLSHNTVTIGITGVEVQ